MIIILISGFIGWDTTAEDVRAALKAAKGDPVKMVITSGGGFVSTGIDIFNQFRNYPGEVHAELSSYAMSIASYIPLSADPGNITAQDNAVYMIHNTRGFVGGDHKQIIKAGNYMKGLSGILAARYAKHTGKPLADISEMMDEETFFFGQEMVDAGFVDVLIDSDDDSSAEGRADALILAQAAFEEVEARMKDDPAAAKADMDRAAAMFQEGQPFSALAPTVPAVAGKPQEEELQMTLAEFLSANPAAKAENDIALAAAEKTGHDAMASTIKKVSPFLASEKYPAIIGTTALAVLSGDSNIIELTSAVAAVDAVREDAASKLAAAAGGEETPAAPNAPLVRKDGEPASTQADLDAEIAAFNEEA